MRSIVLLFFCIIVSFGLASCSWTKVYNDLEEDHIAGKHFLDGFYGAVKNKDLDKIEKLSSDSLLLLKGKERYRQLFEFINLKVGGFEGYEVSEVETKRVEKNGFIKVYYRFRNRVKYENGLVDEVVVLSKLGEKNIEIMSYNVNSDLFMTQ